MDFENLRYELEDGLARLTLARPPRNTTDSATVRELLQASIRLDEDQRVRALLIAAEGQAFSVGGDLREFAKAGDELPAFLKEMTVYLHVAISRLVRSRAPVVCAVGGAVAGGGLSLVLASDLVLAAESATFSYGYSRIGFSPDGSSTYFLPRLLGARRATEFALMGRTLSAGEALEWGLVNKVVADAELQEAASALAAELAEGPTASFAAAKSLFHRRWTEML
jgi:2-(1,2-epoxy-1,2-dihydrophenyl)acetyl-CoA isomerase